jgi:hypothetical protein
MKDLKDAEKCITEISYRYIQHKDGGLATNCSLVQGILPYVVKIDYETV